MTPSMQLPFEQWARDVEDRASRVRPAPQPDLARAYEQSFHDQENLRAQLIRAETERGAAVAVVYILVIFLLGLCAALAYCLRFINQHMGGVLAGS